MTEVLLAVGTRKGLFIGRRRGGVWEFDESPYFNAQALYSVAVDTRGPTPRLLAGGDSSHWGPSVFHSDDLGRTWAGSAARGQVPEGHGGFAGAGVAAAPGGRGTRRGVRGHG